MEMQIRFPSKNTSKILLSFFHRLRAQYNAKLEHVFIKGRSYSEVRGLLYNSNFHTTNYLLNLPMYIVVHISF